MITISNIRKTYGDVVALNNVSFSVKRGEIFGLIGPDGAGKSSLFHILTTLTHATNGTATICGLDIEKDYRKIRSKVGYMPGRFSLYPDLSIAENIRLFAAIFCVNPEDAIGLIEPIYKQIEPFKNRLAGKLSGGMKQKLALCCALIHRPEVLLLDEPTTGVDAVSRQEFWDMLQDIKEQGISVLVSTPYMDEATRCDNIALISNGEIMQVDTPQRLLEQYQLPTIEDVFIYLMSGGQVEKDMRKEEVKTLAIQNAIEVEKLTKRFGNFTAVKAISFCVKKGEIFGFLGANGAGKTTAMRMLCGLSVPSGGKGTVAGFDVTTQAEDIKKHIGYMSQRFSLYDNLTVWENILFYGGVYGLTKSQIEQRGKEELEQLNFYENRNLLVKSLPLGWKQKLAFAISMLHKPEIVFLDEPTGGVDPIVRRQFWQMIYVAAEQGITIFVTTHYMDEAEYCNRLSIMVDGEIKAMDTPANLKKQYKVGSIDEVFRLLARG